MSDFFDSENNIDEYIRMAEGYDGRKLIEHVKSYLKPGATVLELGMGPGKDLDILSKTFKATGSDRSQVFIDRYLKDHPGADVIVLDAVRLDCQQRFDAVYSNKVLHHLSTAELLLSLANQLKLLNSGGLAFHTFWYGDKETEFITEYNLRFEYYTEESILACLTPEWQVLDLFKYEEMAPEDSLFLIMQKQSE